MAKIRMGMVGGGEGAFIGAVHRMAAALDGEIELVCGAFSSDSQRSARSGAALHLAPQRVYSECKAIWGRNMAKCALHLEANSGANSHTLTKATSCCT